MAQQPRRHHLFPADLVDARGVFCAEAAAWERAHPTLDEWRPAAPLGIRVEADRDTPELRHIDRAWDKLGRDDFRQRLEVWHRALVVGAVVPQPNGWLGGPRPERSNSSGLPPVPPPPSYDWLPNPVGVGWQFFTPDGTWIGDRPLQTQAASLADYTKAVNAGALPLPLLLWLNVAAAARVARANHQAMEASQARQAASTANYLATFKVIEGTWQHAQIRWLAAALGGPEAVATVDAATSLGLSAQQIIDGARR